MHLAPARVADIVMNRMYAAGIKHAGRDGVGAHALRHTACVDMLRGGAHIRDVQRAMGHAKLETTAWYLPMVVHGLRQAMGGRWYGPAPTEGTNTEAAPTLLQLSFPGFPLSESDIDPVSAQLNGQHEAIAALDADTAARCLPPSELFGRPR